MHIGMRSSRDGGLESLVYYFLGFFLRPGTAESCNRLVYAFGRTDGRGAIYFIVLVALEKPYRKRTNTSRLALLPIGSGNYGASLITLWDMLWSFVHLFRRGLEELQDVRFSILASHLDEKKLSEKHVKQLQSILGYLSLCSESIALDATKHLADELSETVKPGENTDEIDAKIDSVHSMAKKELKNRKFFYVPPERVTYYSNKTICGPLVAEKFPKAVPDIVEAGNCYALGRPTACVFHLMRVIPYGMKVLSKKLRVKYARPFELLEWGSIIQPIDKAVKDMAQGTRTKKRVADQIYYSEIVTHLYYCKDAWRNHVSHSATTYDMPQARSVFDHVGRVMGMLAERM
ncbi:MAG TPA: hypothetical protein VNX27_05555 [Chthoniobacterales bacterium]|nr:hypothetical protein [Chthoniobacterales bacterium]